MTPDRITQSRAELAELLVDAAQSVSGILTAEYSTPTTLSYLHPVLAPLSVGPRVVDELSRNLEGFLAEPFPTTPASLFTVASYASALGWLTESVAELTTSVDQIGSHVGIPSVPQATGTSGQVPADRDDEFEIALSGSELDAIRTAAEAADLAPHQYIEVLSQSLRAAYRFTDACMEISSGLLEDATVIRQVPDGFHASNGSASLPTLVRSLLARLETDG